MDDYKDIIDLLTPRREVKVSSSFRERIRETVRKRKRSKILKKYILTGVALSAAALFMVILLIPDGLSAAQLLSKTIDSFLGTPNVELQVDIRTLPRDNFILVDPEEEFVTHHIKTRRTDSTTYWSIDKGGRTAVKNSEGVFVWIKEYNIGWYSSNRNTDVLDYLSVFVNPEKTLERELELTSGKYGAKYELKKEKGRYFLTVRSQKEGDFSNPYMLNKSIVEAQTVRRYVINADNNHLESASVAMLVNGEEREVIRITDVKYLHGDIELASIPSGIRFQEMDQLYDNLSGFTGMDEKETASVLFNAFKDWDTSVIYRLVSPDMAEILRKDYEGATLLSMGTPFRSGNQKDLTFVPYSLKLKNNYIKNFNLAITKNSKGVWIVTGGL
ncbi:MAG: hypothetical protein K2H46_05825 [Muribaculaceae bacterium]|nr:hypothetical protein [Muribaculaceae bacterium]